MSQHSQLGLKNVLADLLPALSVASTVSLFSPDESTGSDGDRATAQARVFEARRKLSQASLPLTLEVPSGIGEPTDAEGDSSSAIGVDTDSAAGRSSSVPTIRDTITTSGATNAVAANPVSGMAMNGSGIAAIRRRASVGSHPSKSPHTLGTSMGHGHSSSFGSEEMIAASLPPKLGSGRRRSSLLAYIATGRRPSETNEQPAPLINESAMSSNSSLLDDTEGLGLGGSGNDKLSDFIVGGGMAELVDAAMLGLLRVVSRFQAVFEEAGAGAEEGEGGRGEDSEPSLSRRQSSVGSVGEGRRESLRLLATVQDAARAGRRPSTFARVASFNTMGDREEEEGRRGSTGGRAGEREEEEDSIKRSDTRNATTTTVTLSRDDVEALTSLVDVLTVAWSGGFWGPVATGASQQTPAAANEPAPEGAEHPQTNTLSSTLSSNPPSPVSRGSAAGSRRSSQSDFEAAFSTIGITAGAPLTMATVGGMLRRASAAISNDQSVFQLLSVRRGSQGFAAIPEGELPTEVSMVSDTTDQEEQNRDRTGSVASKASSSTNGDARRRPSGVSATADALVAAAGETPRTARRGSVAGPSHNRHRSTRTMAKEELQRSFLANPQIFDESTREYVASLVSPPAAPKPKTAKERLRAGVAKVVRVAAIAKRLSSLAASNKPLLPPFSGGSETPSPVEALAPKEALHSHKEPSTPPLVPDASMALADCRKKLGNLEPVLRKLSGPDAFVFEGLERWDFDIIKVNSLLLCHLGLLGGSDVGPANEGVSAIFAHRPKPVQAPLLPQSSVTLDPVHQVVSEVEKQTSDAATISSVAATRHAVDARLAETSKGANARPCTKFTDIPDSGNGLGVEMLVALTFRTVETVGAIDDLGIDRDTMFTFLARVGKGYHSQPYHNALHGADVAQAMFHLLTVGGMGTKLSVENKVAALLASAVHDVGHPGFNNVYLSQTHHPLALTYNDKSPLENMHAATAFLTMRKQGCEIFACLSNEQRNDMRAMMIDMILATDNAHHFKLIGKIRRRLARAMRATPTPRGKLDDEDYTSSDDGLSEPEEPSSTVTHPIDLKKTSDARLVLQTTLHACDIANPARSWEVCVKWTDRITEEFWMQGDKLREQGLPVPPMHDRIKPIPRPNMQAGFITALVLPLWTHMTEPAFKQVVDVSYVLSGLKTTLGKYTDMIEKAKAAASSTSS